MPAMIYPARVAPGRISFLTMTAIMLAAAGCGGSGGDTSITPPPAVVLTLGSSTVTVPQDGVPASLTLSVSGPTGTPTVSVNGLPAGITAQFTPASGGTSASLAFTGSATAAAGAYPATVVATIGSVSAQQTLTVTSAVVAKLSSTQDTALGVKGVLQQFMSTSFQVDQYNDTYFSSGATETSRESTLGTLGPQHVRVQGILEGAPMLSNTGTAADWSFSTIDNIVQPLLTVGDKSPEFQIAVAPPWMCTSSGTLDVANHLNDFVAYAANLVRYYNKGGFTWGGTHFQSASAQPIEVWGIFNEPNGNGLTAAQYTELYNAVVPAMLAVDPTLQFSAIEFSDYGLGTGEAGDPEGFLSTFLAPAASGGVKAQVNFVSTHLYGTCNQLDSDATLMNGVPPFAQNVSYFYQELAKRSDLANVGVWVTENNVNADFAQSNGMSTCNPSQKFVVDARGSSAFFAAWRPYVFAQLGKVGNQALYQWDYSDNTQFGEVDPSGTPYLSYWVDHTLATLYPSTQASPGEKILTLNATDTASVETLATENTNGTVTVMIVDHAVNASTDNNGAGAPRTVIVDLSGLNAFSAASLLTLDANTNTTNGPASEGITPAARMTVTLSGYGTAFLTLTP